eukprot:7890411-Pyramimonas_sp.AAC.1
MGPDGWPQEIGRSIGCDLGPYRIRKLWKPLVRCVVACWIAQALSRRLDLAQVSGRGVPGDDVPVRGCGAVASSASPAQPRCGFTGGGARDVQT